MQIIAILLALALGYSLGLYIVAPGTVQEMERLQLERVVRHRGGPAAIAAEPERGFVDRFLRPLIDQISQALLRHLPRRQGEILQRRLERAGNPTTPGVLLGSRFLLLIVGLLPALFGGLAILMAAALAILGWRLPDFWLARRATARQQAMLRHLPDVMDLLSVSVEAGLGFDAALARVTGRFGEPVVGEFGRLLRELQLGRPRAEALRDLAQRMDLPDLSAFVGAVVQADELGVGIASVLRAQSEQMRALRRQRAQEAALKVPIKMLFPLIFLVFPAMFIVLLGPAVLSFVHALHH